MGTMGCRVLLALILSLAFHAGEPSDEAAAEERIRVLGAYTYPSNSRTFGGTIVGGLSDLTYDAQQNVYYAISDDRGESQPARFFTLEIDIGLTGISDVRVVGMTTLDSDASLPGIQPYERNTIDAEGIVLLPNRELLISSERDSQDRPWIRRYALDGTLLGEVALPDRFVPNFEAGPNGRPTVVQGIRVNLAFEGLALTPDGRSFYVANEEALAQDGPVATPDQDQVVRIVRYDLGESGWQAGPEVAYRTEKIFSAPIPPTAFADHGVPTLLWAEQLWPEFDLLIMEKAFSTGVGNDVRLFGVRLAGAARTESLAALPEPYTGAVATKTELIRLSEAGIQPDNLEGMTFGPRLPNGKPSLIAVSDDNFSASQVNQFVLFELSETAASSAAGAPAAPPPTLAPATGQRPPSPAQIPSALPRAGGLPAAVLLGSLGVALIGLGLSLLGPGCRARILRRRARRGE
jgi:hypothetical protein